MLKIFKDLRQLINDGGMTALRAIIRNQKDHIQTMKTRIEKEKDILNKMEPLLNDQKDKMNKHLQQQTNSFSNLIRGMVRHNAQNEEHMNVEQNFSFAQIAQFSLQVKNPVIVIS